MGAAQPIKGACEQGKRPRIPPMPTQAAGQAARVTPLPHAPDLCE